MTKKNRSILISILILYVALLIGTFFSLKKISDWRHEGKILDETVQLQTIMDCYAQAKIYKDERVGDKYELHSIGGEMSSDKDEITFTYTKRKGMFKNVYFITIDRREKKIIVTGQAEANRLFGSDINPNVEKWIFDFDTVDRLGQGLDIDRVFWNSYFEYEPRVNIYYDKSDGTRAEFMLNPYTNEFYEW